MRVCSSLCQHLILSVFLALATLAGVVESRWLLFVLSLCIQRVFSCDLLLLLGLLWKVLSSDLCLFHLDKSSLYIF